jgi:c-di-GMP-related signal transduction protein
MEQAPELTLTDLVVPLLRQPILNADREVWGYELVDRSPTGNGLREALEHGTPLQRPDGKPVFVRGTRSVLDSPAVKEAAPDTLVLHLTGVPGDKESEIEALAPELAALHERGVRFALDRSTLKKVYTPWLKLAAYVKLDAVDIEPALFERLLKFVADQTTAVPIACRVHTQQRFEALVKLNVPLFQGNWYSAPKAAPTGTIKPSQAVVIQLMNLLRRDAEIDEIEPLLKRDPSLSFNLLRAINSSGMGLSCEVTSLRHAVMILGQKRLFRWAAMLMTMSRAAGTAPAVATTAMVRARLMELLAAELLPKAECDNAFVTGVFSLLDVMLDMPMAAALDSLALPQSVGDALLRQEGLLAPFLKLTLACESGEDEAFADAANALHLSSHQVNWAHVQALAWAEELAQGW